MAICLECSADLHMAQPLTISCFSKIQIAFTFLVPHQGSLRQRAIKRVCVCVCVCVRARACACVCARAFMLEDCCRMSL